MSLSARRAWIEIGLCLLHTAMQLVALRKESVDRNDALPEIDALKLWSLSARRAWIEIVGDAHVRIKHHLVALRKESVDRNSYEKG